MSKTESFIQPSPETADQREGGEWVVRQSGSANEEGHWIITGTGRAGTTFLVQYLAELGLDTHLAHHTGADAQYDEHANAGLEDFGMGDAESLPGIIKSPWISEYIAELLGRPDVSIRLAILPVRELWAAASSRLVLELRARHEHNPWLADMASTWETWGTVPGGALYSLHPLDQARVLAVGFHRLVQHLVEAEIPILFLDFPRFIRDAEYLVRRLRPHLPEVITDETAINAHRRVADLCKVRIEREAASGTSSSPGCVQLENMALKRELRRLHRRSRERADELAKASLKEGAEREELRRKIEHLQEENRRLNSQKWWQRLFRTCRRNTEG